MKVNPVSNQKKYKTKFTVETKQVLWTADEHQEEDAMMTHENDVCVRILKVDDDTVCVEFTNMNGPQLTFLNIYNEMKQVLNMTNDVFMDSKADVPHLDAMNLNEQA